ncbi:hypothetical protein [Thioalkalivibrio sp. K90mix]|uniref:hypothetical protein n=1 Tax=Thioalkalivibrio sp. (strain K90mix) TaxID=396595 RepID=UPI000475DB8E|nr:hypothetical protein [Thioalkalivibrio sp. K90mix]
MKEIKKPIIAVHRGGGPQAPAENKPADIDPLERRISSRPEGELPAVSQKICYYTQDGKQTVYLLVSFMPVEGMVDGEKVVIERPIEFFLPTGQQSDSYQWISATMRSLSLAARGGYAAQALMDLRQVTWDKGPVRCGLNEYRKPVYHNSEAAAIAYSIQMILYRRGFLDLDGNQLPLWDLVEAYQGQISPVRPAAVQTPPPGEESGVPQQGDCPQCGGATQMMDGCPTCLDCGYSKCL